MSIAVPISARMPVGSNIIMMEDIIAEKVLDGGEALSRSGLGCVGLNDPCGPLYWCCEGLMCQVQLDEKEQIWFGCVPKRK